MKIIATFLRLRAWALLGLCALAGFHAARAATVDTVGGGPFNGNLLPYGYADGDTAAVSQFNGPSGLAFDITGNLLFVADRTNNAVRKLDLAANRTSTFAATNYVTQPVDVVLDAASNVYVLNYAKGTNGFVSKFNRYANYLGTILSGLTNATAMTIDGNTNLYITEMGGSIKRISRTGVVTNLARVNVAGVKLKGITMTEGGHLLVSDAGNHALWLVNLASGAISLFTGGMGPGDTMGVPGFAQFNQPEHLARAGGGMIVVADRGNHRVKLVDASGAVTLLYGVTSNLWVYYPAPGVYPGWWDGENCELEGCAEAREPVGVAVQASGSVFVSEGYYHLIREASGAELLSPSYPPPTTPLFAGLAGIAFDHAGDSGSRVYLADSAKNVVFRFTAQGGPATPFLTNNLSQPVAVAVDGRTNIFVLNQGSGTLLKFNSQGNLLGTVASNFALPTAMTMDSLTNLYVVEQAGRVWRIEPSGLVTNFATITQPGVQLRGVTITDDGFTVVSDAGNHALWQIHPINSAISLLTGNNGPGATLGAQPFVQLNQPQQVARAGGNMLVVADAGNSRMILVDRNGNASDLADATPNVFSQVFFGRSDDPIYDPNSSRFVPLTRPGAVAVDGSGNVYSTDLGGQVLRQTFQTGLSGPNDAIIPLFNGVAGLASNVRYVFLADQDNNVVRRIEPGIRTVTFASTNLNRPVAVALDPADNVYVLNEGNGTLVKFNRFANLLPWNISGLAQPAALGLDSLTNIFICELGGAVKRVTPAGVVTTLGTVIQPGVQLRGLAVMDDGVVVVSDAGNHALWQVNPISGTVSLLTGNNGPGYTLGTAPYVQLDTPQQLAKAGNYTLVVADQGNDRLLLVDRYGTATLIVEDADPTILGSSVFYGRPGDPVKLGSSRFVTMASPRGVVINSLGKLYTSESVANIVRSIDVGGILAPGVATSPLFNAPAGLAFNAAGTMLFVADQTNNAVRRIELASRQTLTFATVGLNRPVALALDVANNVYVLNQGSGDIVKFNSFANLLPWAVAGFTLPTAMVIDNSTNLFVCESGGAIKRISPAGAVTLVATVARPGVDLRGIVVMDDGMVAVSDAGNHALWLVNPATGTNTLLTGNNGPGAAWGAKPFVQFNSPQQIAKAGGDVLVVADRNNNRLLVVDRAGTATNLPALDAPIFYGQAGDTVASTDARYVALALPAGVIVAPNGDVFTSEPVASVVRWVTGTGLAGPGGVVGGGGGAGVMLAAPVFTPKSGYFPMGQIIAVTCMNPVYYTTDGTEPTTNSPSVTLDGNIGSIHWTDSLRDLTSLRLKAIAGTNASATVAGTPVSVNEIGVTRNVIAGVGSTILVPIVMNLKSNEQVRSLIYRVEIAPQNGAPPVHPNFTAIDISTNDFVPLTGAFTSGTVGQSSPSSYLIPNPTNSAEWIPGGLTLSVIGLNPNFLVQRYAAVALLKVPIRPDAPEGSTYTITLKNVVASSDGQQIEVAVTTMPSQQIIVSNLSYTVGDSSPGVWYNAGDFGDQDLAVGDINNAFYAAVGAHVPFTFSDAFDAMDAWPPDDAGFLGGDGEIRFLDWQLILQRALRLDTNNYQRAWSAGGVRVPSTTTLRTRSSLKSKSSNTTPAPGAVWVRQATLSSVTVGGVAPGGFCMLPVVVKVAPGCSLAGLSFRAAVTAESGAPAIGSLTFTPASGLPAPAYSAAPSPNERLCGWALVPTPAFQPALQGSNVIGYIGFTVPITALAGQCYTLRFLNADGAPNLSTAYNLENIPASVWIGTPALRSPELVSDQWKTNFFGSLTNALAEAYADPDHDGVPNWQEYLAGTNPTNAASRLQLFQSRSTNSPRALVLTWLSAPGKTYTAEWSDHVGSANWTPVASGLVGSGNVLSCVDTNAIGQTRFYRIRLQP